MEVAKFDRIEKILDFAVSREVQAHKFYLKLAKRTKDPELRKVLKELAGEELCHKGRLQAVKKGKLELFSENKVDIQLDDRGVEVGPGLLIDRQDIIALAIRKEEESIRLYRTLARTLDWGGLRDTFLLLAQEEAEHRSRFEAESKNTISKPI